MRQDKLKYNSQEIQKMNRIFMPWYASVLYYQVQARTLACAGKRETAE